MTDGASGTAATECAGPATLLQHQADLAGDLTRSGGDIRPCVAQGNDAGASEVAVPAHVTPSSLRRVGGEAIELYIQAEFAVQVVEVCVSGIFAHASLPGRLGQPMPSLDVPQIASLKIGVNSGLDLLGRCQYLTPPPHVWPARGCSPDLFGGDESASAGCTEPVKCAVKAL